MMCNSFLRNTLNAMEQLELAFQQSLQAIDSISHRYQLVSGLKSRAKSRQQSYEAEIMAAITEPTLTKICGKKCKKRKKMRMKLVKKKYKTEESQTDPMDVAEEEYTENCICSYDNREHLEAESLDLDEGFDEFSEAWPINDWNYFDREANLCTENTHYCSFCRCETICFNVD